MWSANGGCNVVSGSRRVDANGHFDAESEVQFDVDCDLAPGDVLPKLAVVERATTWRLDGNHHLILEAEDGTVLEQFRR